MYSRLVLALRFLAKLSFIFAVLLALLTAHAEAQEQVRIILFTPADLSVPDGSRQRLTQIADAADKFYFHWMNHWDYLPTAKSLFRREPDGLVEMLTVRGDQPASSGKYARPNFADAVARQAVKQYHIHGNAHVWWIFIFLGDRPVRFGNWAGMGNSVAGGWAMVNYDTLPGDISSELSFVQDFNGKIFLKGLVHELGHAFGLPHMGPSPELGLGNSLMGPVTTLYAAKSYPKPDQVYLDEASAAMLWKHPIFTGTNFVGFHRANAKLLDYKATYDQTNDSVTVTGRLVSHWHAHTVVLIDDLGKPNDMYWSQSHAARVSTNGTFQLNIHHPARKDGHYRILFCFDNGVVSGDGAHVRFVDRGDIKKSYHFVDGNFEFGD